MSDPDEVRVVSTAGARFRGGLFIASIEFRSDRVIFSVFTSRRTSYRELAERLTLRDGLGTDYTMQPFDDIDGKGTFEFTPGIPAAATSWQLGEPGRALTWATLDEEPESSVTPT
jgi:hypothetical protein